jgi:L-amino acid N-acyltransferase YncA
LDQPYTIRDANQKDLARIVEIYNSTIQSRMVTADTEMVDIESRLDWFLNHTSEKRPLWVMEDDGMIVGWLSFQDFYGRPAYQATAEISIYIDPAYRKKGIGAIFLDYAIKNAPNLRIQTLLGFIFAHNEPSIRLFKKFGFEQWAHLPGVAELDGVKRDLLILGQRIE